MLFNDSWFLSKPKDKYKVVLYCTNCESSNYYFVQLGTPVKDVTKNIMCKNCKCKGFLKDDHGGSYY